MKKKILVISFTLIALASILSGCSLKSASNDTSLSEVSQSKIINLNGEEGKSVYDLLKAQNQVEASDSSFGVMIKSINGLASNDKEFWLYSVNGTPAEVAADKYISKTGDQIVWEYKGI